MDTRCRSMLRPDLPGYFPTILVAVRSKRVAPSSVQMAWRSMDLPQPSGPTSRTDLMPGVFSLSSGEPRGRMQYSVTSLLTSAGPGAGSAPRDLRSAPR